MANGLFAQAPNDSCQYPTPWGGPGTHDFSTLESTSDAPAQCPRVVSGVTLAQTDVWYTYTAASTGVAEMDVLTVVSLNRGVGLSIWSACNGTVQACASNARTSPLHFDIVDGQTYLVRVATHANSNGTLQMGTGTLSIAEYNTPITNETCEAPYPVTGPGTYLYDTTNATAHAPFPSCSLGNDPTQQDVWVAYTASQTGVATFTVGSATDNPDNRDTAIAIFSSCNSSSELACSGYNATVGQWWTSVPVTAGQTYLVRLANAADSYSWKLLKIREDVPQGDSCTSPKTVVVGSNSWSNAGVIDNNTYETPMSCAGGARAFQWFVFTPPSSGIAAFSTDGSNVDTVMEAYDACGGNLLACNDHLGFDGNLDTESFVNVRVQHNVPVYVRVGQALSGGNNDFFRSGTLSVSMSTPLANDECASAQVIEAGGTHAYDNRLATSSAGLAPSCGADLSKDLWYSWTPAQDGLAFIHNCGSYTNGLTRRSTLTIYDACGGGEITCNLHEVSLELLANLPGFDYTCNSSFSSGFSLVSFFAEGGRSYLVRVATHDADYQDLSGSGELSVQFLTFDAATAFEVLPNHGDIGEVPAAAWTPAGNGALNAIMGMHSVSTDVDLWKIRICDPENFTATTFNDYTSFDTVLSLYDSSGVGVAFHDDRTDDTTSYHRSLLTDRYVNSEGEYYLAISSGGYLFVPVSNGQNIWYEDPRGVERSPDGPGFAGPLTGWAGNTGSTGGRIYRIDLTGVCFAEQVSICAADFNNVNGVTVQDIFDFLTAWLAGNASANFNGVNGVTVQDIFDFLTAWLAGC